MLEKTRAIAGQLPAIGRFLAPPRARQTSETAAAYASARTRILILGAGFGGISTALALEQELAASGASDGVSILVVDRDNSQLFTPLLWFVASGRASPGDIVVPIRAFQPGRAFHILQAEITEIDLDGRQVMTTAGARPYDILVIALGSITALPNVPGLRQHARTFNTAGDALELRNHLIDAIETAYHTEDPGERRAWLTFVVGGGGDTGVELAATIADYLHSGLLATYPWLTTTAPRVVIVGRNERLVPMSAPKTSAAVERILRRAGIEVKTGVAITGVTERSVMTSEGDIPARALFWAAGVTAPAIVRDLPLDHARNGAIIVDDCLRTPDHPEVYAIGDSAWAIDPTTGQGVPPTAQAAEHQGRFVARAIVAGLTAQSCPSFQFRPRGHLALLGRRTGVAHIGRFHITGLPAWLLWHGYYLSRIPPWRNRFHLVLDLILAGLLGRQTAQLRLRAGRPEEHEEREKRPVA